MANAGELQRTALSTVFIENNNEPALQKKRATGAGIESTATRTPQEMIAPKSSTSTITSSNSPASAAAAAALAAPAYRGKKFSALINRGVECQTMLVGIQHRFLLGIAPPTVGGGSSSTKLTGTEGMCRGCSVSSKGVSSSTAGATKSERCTRCSSSPRKRYLYQLVERVADFSERASFHRGFLCWTYASRLLAAGLFFLMAVYLNALATMVATHRNPYAMMLDRSGAPLNAHTLPDLGHDLWAFFLTRLGHHTDYIDEHALPDKMVSFAGNVAFLFICCHPQRLKITRRVFTIFGTVLLMRAVSVSVTVLPDASPVCRERFENGAAIAELFPGAFWEALRFVWAPTSFVTCGDMVFSGHTTCLVMVAMTFRKYCRAKHLQTKVVFTGFHLTEAELTLVRRMVYAYVALGCLVIIGSKLHYTLDVLLAILVSYCTFTGYHDWARHAQLRKKIKILRWLESEDVLGQDNLAYSKAKRP